MNTSTLGLKIVLALLLLLDLSYSFQQYISEPIDGDLVGIVLPSDWYQPVLSDPFGFKLLNGSQEHAGANRYFIHQTMSTYLREMPLVLQSFSTPIDSVYLAIGIFKLATHLLILYLLSLFVCGTKIIWRKEFLIAVALITPLLQANGVFKNYIGIVSGDITYVFFYAFPLALLLLFYWPFYKKYVYGKTEVKNSMGTKALLLFLIIFLSFSGPLIQPIVLMICPSALVYFWWRNFNFKNDDLSFFQKMFTPIRSIPSDVLFYFSSFTLLCFYSFYLGTFNAESSEAVSITERFLKLGNGIIHQLTGRFAFSFLLIIVLLNSFLVKRFYPNESAKQLMKFGKIIFLFSIVYTFLLPLGGYRDYRPNIVRADTLMPVVLCLFFYYGKTSLFLIQHLTSKNKKVFLFAVLAVAIIFTLVDIPNFEKNQCEKTKLAIIATSKKDLVVLDRSCLMISWDIKTNPERTRDNCELLLHWNIIKDMKLYSEQ